MLRDFWRTAKGLAKLPLTNPVPAFCSPFRATVFIMDKYFPDEDDVGADTGVDAPQVDASGAFAFQPQMAAPSGGFSFAPAQQ